MEENKKLSGYEAFIKENGIKIADELPDMEDDSAETISYSLDTNGNVVPIET